MNNATGFIDIHSHLLPGVDHGADTMEEALGILFDAAQAGVRKLALTPHVAGDTAPDLIETMVRQFNSLKELVRQSGVNIELHMGAELMLHPELLSRLQGDRRLTINGKGKYALVEMPVFSKPIFADTVFFDLLARGFVPIWAHPERCVDVMEDYTTLIRHKENGVLLQINAGSLAELYGRRTAKTVKKMIEKGLVHMVASDTHHRHDKGVALRDAYRSVVKIVGDCRADEIFFANPSKVLE
jgi:protein-tyrosine phosphatase